MDGTYDDGEDVLDESQSLLSKATIPRNFTDLIKTDKSSSFFRFNKVFDLIYCLCRSQIYSVDQH